MLIGEKWGCLEIVDDGLEFCRLVNDQIEDIRKEKEEFIRAVKNNELKSIECHSWGSNGDVKYFKYVYTPTSFKSAEFKSVSNFDKYLTNKLIEYNNTIQESDFDAEVNKLIEKIKPSIISVDAKNVERSGTTLKKLFCLNRNFAIGQCIVRRDLHILLVHRMLHTENGRNIKIMNQFV